MWHCLIIFLISNISFHLAAQSIQFFEDFNVSGLFHEFLQYQRVIFIFGQLAAGEAEANLIGTARKLKDNL